MCACYINGKIVSSHTKNYINSIIINLSKFWVIFCASIHDLLHYKQCNCPSSSRRWILKILYAQAAVCMAHDRVMGSDPKVGISKHLDTPTCIPSLVYHNPQHCCNNITTSNRWTTHNKRAWVMSDECYHPGLFACTVAILTHGKLLWSINNNYLAHQNSKF